MVALITIPCNFSSVRYRKTAESTEWAGYKLRNRESQYVFRRTLRLGHYTIWAFRTGSLFYKTKICFFSRFLQNVTGSKTIVCNRYLPTSQCDFFVKTVSLHEGTLGGPQKGRAATTRRFNKACIVKHCAMTSPLQHKISISFMFHPVRRRSTV